MSGLRLLTALVAAFFCVFSGCSSTEPADPADAGEISFLLNGEPWPETTPTVVAQSLYGYEVTADHWIEGRFPLHRRISFVVPAAEWVGPQRYPLDFGLDDRGSPQSSAFTEMNGDEIVARYRPLPGGAFEVTRYDEATREIAGRFEGVFVVDADDVDADYRLLPDTVRVTEGRFRAPVDDRR
jgi:hypothetical protein